MRGGALAATAVRRRRAGQGRRRHLYYDGTAVGTGRVGASQPMIFSADETTDIGYESGTTVTPDYTVGSSRFTGKINWVQIDLGKDDHDHFIDVRPVGRSRCFQSCQSATIAEQDEPACPAAIVS
jgi:hypothetical protein